MSDTMFVALMSLAGTVIGTLGGIAMTTKLIDWRLKKLEDKVDKHNCVIQRMTVAEINIRTIGTALGIEIAKPE